MRIFYAVLNRKAGIDTAFDPGYWSDRDFYSTLNEMGHELIRFDWELPKNYDVIEWKMWHQKQRERKNDELVEKVKNYNDKKKIDLFFANLDNRFTNPETIERIKRLGICTLNYHCDDLTAFNLNQDLAPVYDYNWSTQPSAIENYKNIGAKVIYAPMGANPKIYKSYDCKKEFDVTFVGRRMGYREELIRFIDSLNVDVRVWGYGWAHKKTFKNVFAENINNIDIVNFTKDLIIWLWEFKTLWGSQDLRRISGSPLSYDDMIKMYSRSKINLNFSGGVGNSKNDFNLAQKTIKLRDFEVTMSGGFYLTEYLDDLKRIYKLGEEIVCYHNENDLVDKIKYYLENEDEREAIRTAGYQRAHCDYKWGKIFTHLFEQMGVT